MVDSAFPWRPPELMLPLTFLMLLVLSLGHWLFTPLFHALTPLLSLAWLGWLLLVVLLWLFAGSPGTEPQSIKKPDP